MEDRAKEIVDYVTEGHDYRNKFETWEDAYINLKQIGFEYEQIIKRIGKKK